MKIAVIAANGRAGRAFVTAALAAGHSVHAGVHGEARFDEHPLLEVMPCDATNLAQVTQLITGQDAVASFIGHTPRSPATVQADATKTIVAAMQQLGVKRFVSLTGTGVRQAGDRIPFIDYLMTLGIRLLDPKRVADGIAHARILEQSQLDWTIIRVLKLQPVTPRPFALTPHGPTKWYVSREDVAQAVLQVLQQDSYIHEMPILSHA
jgi:putative NADH-flavin reductase